MGRFTAVNEENKFFQTWGEFLDFCVENSGKECGSSRMTMNAWAGSESFEAAVEIARNGWPEGLDRVKTLSDRLVSKITQLVERETVNYDVTGLDIDMGAYMRGEPECWLYFEKHMEKDEGTRHLRVCFDATVSSGISTEIMMSRGAAVAALVQCLEFSGCRVQLEVLPLCHGDLWESRVLVKAADQELDMARVAFALAHPSMLRRLGFAVLEGCPRRAKESGSGYGPVSTMVDRGDIAIDGAMLGAPQWDNPRRAAEWIIRQLKEQGIAMHEVDLSDIPDTDTSNDSLAQLRGSFRPRRRRRW